MTGRYVYGDHGALFAQRGYRRLFTHPGNATHNAYLERMGLIQETSTELGRLYCLIMAGSSSEGGSVGAVMP